MRSMDGSKYRLLNLLENGRMKYQWVDKWTFRMDGYGGVSNCDLCDVFDPVHEFTRLEDGRVMFMCKDCQADLKL